MEVPCDVHLYQDKWQGADGSERGVVGHTNNFVILSCQRAMASSPSIDFNALPPRIKRLLGHGTIKSHIGQAIELASNKPVTKDSHTQVLARLAIQEDELMRNKACHRILRELGKWFLHTACLSPNKSSEAKLSIATDNYIRTHALSRSMHKMAQQGLDAIMKATLTPHPNPKSGGSPAYMDHSLFPTHCIVYRHEEWRRHEYVHGYNVQEGLLCLLFLVRRGLLTGHTKASVERRIKSLLYKGGVIGLHGVLAGIFTADEACLQWPEDARFYGNTPPRESTIFQLIYHRGNPHAFSHFTKEFYFAAQLVLLELTGACFMASHPYRPLFEVEQIALARPKTYGIVTAQGIKDMLKKIKVPYMFLEDRRIADPPADCMEAMRQVCLPSAAMETLLTKFVSDTGAMKWDLNKTPFGRGLGVQGLPVGRTYVGLDGQKWRVKGHSNGQRSWVLVKKRARS